LATVAFSAVLGIIHAGASSIFQDKCVLQLVGAIPLRGLEGRIDHMAAMNNVSEEQGVAAYRAFRRALERKRKKR
jgi:hypothetical protein